MKRLSAREGWEAVRALVRERSALGALRVMFGHLGYFFRIPLPGFAPFVVAGPRANRAVVVSERAKLRWRNSDPVTELLRRGLLVVDGEEHDRLRALMNGPLAPGSVPDFEGMIRRQTDRVSAGWRDGQTVDMLVEGRKIALLIILETLFGVDGWDDLPRLWMPILKAIRFISPGPWLVWRGIPRAGYGRALRVLDDYLYGIIAARRRGGSGEANLLDHLIAAGLDDDSLRDQMLTLLIAGHDTSTALLAWTFALLGEHPEIHNQLVRELDQATEREPLLLEEVIKESLRLYPPIHLGSRTAVEAVEFEGGRVPAGERLFYSIYLSHRDPAHWERPDEFCPARFDPGQAHSAFSYLPFGGGPRACIGAAFGQAEARLVIARLLRGFDFEPRGVKIHAHMGATLEPRPGVMMRVRRRG